MAAQEYQLQSLRVIYRARRRSELQQTIENLQSTLAVLKESPEAEECSAFFEDIASECSNRSDIDVSARKTFTDINSWKPDVEGTNDNRKEKHTFVANSSCYGGTKSLNTLLKDEGIREPVPQRLGRLAWRVTYLKSPFKYKYAIRHYVFHVYRYSFLFYNIRHPRTLVAAILGSMTPATECRCHFSWHYSPPHNHPVQNPLLCDKPSSPWKTKKTLTDNIIRRILDEESAIGKITKKVQKLNANWFMQ